MERLTLQMPSQAAAITAIETFMPGTRTGSFAPWCRRITRKPLQPLLIHAGEVFILQQNDGGACDLFQGAAGRIENGSDVRQALACLFLNRVALDLPRFRIHRTRS